VDALTVTVDGQPWGAAQPPRAEPTAREVAVLAHAAVRIEDLSVAAVPPARRRARDLFGSARVVALGENSHGAAALFDTKLEVIRYLVRERGFGLLALETPATEADTVNEYVLGRSSDEQAALAALVLPAWQTDAMWRVVRWLREHNRTATAPVQLRGFDVQQPRLAAAALAAVLRGAGLGELAASAALLQQELSADRATPALLARARALSEDVARSAGGLAPDLRARCNRYARVLESGIRMDRPDLGGATRDAAMADELCALLAEPGTGRNVVVWADNTHVSRAPGAMGASLAERLGADYLAVGFTFGRGHYSAYGREHRYPVQPGFPGSHEHVLARGPGSFLVSLPSLPPGHPLRGIAGFRSIGSRPQRLSQFHPTRLAEHFDVVGFVPETAATHYLVEHDFP
jgi:erythromycin esterase